MSKERQLVTCTVSLVPSCLGMMRVVILNSPPLLSNTPDRMPQLSMPLLVLDLAYLHTPHQNQEPIPTYTRRMTGGHRSYHLLPPDQLPYIHLLWISSCSAARASSRATPIYTGSLKNGEEASTPWNWK